ncbi:hypothetical protein ETB97_003184 [Aspergillus alliaceus]|uniref:Uncharacterized protein n=1 Tax=Petromyces alliaceus TaxID=209559 RepID=A0A8H6A261_PETAA|nr:hypothetical protein ETB97_003184 [Aspergillus burnettii]
MTSSHEKYEGGLKPPSSWALTKDEGVLLSRPVLREIAKDKTSRATLYRYGGHKRTTYRVASLIYMTGNRLSYENACEKCKESPIFDGCVVAEGVQYGACATCVHFSAKECTLYSRDKDASLNAGEDQGFSHNEDKDTEGKAEELLAAFDKRCKRQRVGPVQSSQEIAGNASRSIASSSHSTPTAHRTSLAELSSSPEAKLAALKPRVDQPKRAAAAVTPIATSLYPASNCSPGVSKTPEDIVRNRGLLSLKLAMMMGDLHQQIATGGYDHLEFVNWHQFSIAQIFDAERDRTLPMLRPSPGLTLESLDTTTICEFLQSGHSGLSYLDIIAAASAGLLTQTVAKVSASTVPAA